MSTATGVNWPIHASVSTDADVIRPIHASVRVHTGVIWPIHASVSADTDVIRPIHAGVSAWGLDGWQDERARKLWAEGHLHARLGDLVRARRRLERAHCISIALLQSLAPELQPPDEGFFEPVPETVDGSHFVLPVVDLEDLV